MSRPTSFPLGISVNGMPFIPGLLQTTGNVFFVQNTLGSDANSGTDSEHPRASINACVDLCTAGRGDVIIAMPDHYEAITTDSNIDLDKTGIRLIGFGLGDNIPRIDFTATAATFVVGANNVQISGINFHANVPDIVAGVVVEAGVDFANLINNRFSVETTGTDEFLISIQTNDASNAFTIRDNYIDMGLGDAVHAIKLVADSDNSVIQGNNIFGDYSTANIGGITTLSTNLGIYKNRLTNGESGNLNSEPVIEMLTGTTGWVEKNTFYCNLATVAAYTVADTMIFANNFAGEDAGAAAGAILRTDAASVTGTADD